MWIEDFLSAFLPPSKDDIDIKLAMSIKNKSLPKSLFRYRPFNKHSLENYKSDTVWLTSPDKYNDPYDSALAISQPKVLNTLTQRNFTKLVQKAELDRFLSKSELSELSQNSDILSSLSQLLLSKAQDISEDHKKILLATTKGYSEKAFCEMTNDMNSYLKRCVGICSFSEINSSVVMWSHYADKHEGFCLEYDFCSLPTNDIRRYLLYPVIYSEDLFDATPYLQERIVRGDFNNLFPIIAYIHKAKEWTYEKEWRLIDSVGPSFSPHNLKMPTPKAIYLGARIKMCRKKKLETIAVDKGIPVFKMILSQSKFKLETVEA